MCLTEELYLQTSQRFYIRIHFLSDCWLLSSRGDETKSSKLIDFGTSVADPGSIEAFTSELARLRVLLLVPFNSEVLSTDGDWTALIFSPDRLRFAGTASSDPRPDELIPIWKPKKKNRKKKTWDYLLGIAGDPVEEPSSELCFLFGSEKENKGFARRGETSVELEADKCILSLIRCPLFLKKIYERK